jgi:hypothetical protein
MVALYIPALISGFIGGARGSLMEVHHGALACFAARQVLQTAVYGRLTDSINSAHYLG